MAILNPSENPIKVESKIKKEVKQEYKLLGTGILKPGQKLFGMGDDLKIYQVSIIRKKTVAYKNEKKASSMKAQINPNHMFLKAINMKNALRKFRNMIRPIYWANFNKVNNL